MKFFGPFSPFDRQTDDPATISIVMYVNILLTKPTAGFKLKATTTKSRSRLFFFFPPKLYMKCTFDVEGYVELQSEVYIQGHIYNYIHECHNNIGLFNDFFKLFFFLEEQHTSFNLF